MSRVHAVKSPHHASESVPLRLLIPIDATERSRWGIRYALWRHEGGKPVQASLLFVAEPITSREVLWFRTQEEVARFQAERGQWLLEDASLSLVQAGIEVNSHFREGEVVFQILDVAEQLGCDEIVLPLPQSRLIKLLVLDVVREVLRQRREIPVVTVNAEGMPERGRHH